MLLEQDFAPKLDGLNCETANKLFELRLTPDEQGQLNTGITVKRRCPAGGIVFIDSEGGLTIVRCGECDLHQTF
ncbi:hypothetical protein HYW54_04685 [Candidatus Gottesmanbacteria bacterium]|nr:hypothetical protein [Candidatus Gottesmanbacteria bacterium]